MNINEKEKEELVKDIDEEDEEDISDEKENILLSFFLENILSKLNSNTISTKQKTELYRFILNYNNVKDIEDNEYLENKNILKYYILGWYVTNNANISKNI